MKLTLINTKKGSRKIFSFLLLILTFFASANCQESQSKSEKELLKAKELARQFDSTGVLLIRLSSKSEAINKLKAINPQQAKKVKEEVNKENTEIIKAFSENYTLTPVYYFFSEHSSNISEKNFKGFVLNNKLQPELDFTGVKKTILIGEFGTLDVDKLGINALYLMDSNFETLKKPFPYYVRTLKPIFFLKRNKNKTVANLNSVLLQFSK